MGKKRCVADVFFFFQGELACVTLDFLALDSLFFRVPLRSGSFEMPSKAKDLLEML